MFVDELTIKARAGDGGDGVVRWLRERHRPKGGPAGGNGGSGGDVYMRAVKDLGLLSRYTGTKEFRAENGQNGREHSQYGKDGGDIYIDVPVGSRVTDVERKHIYEFNTPGETYKILHGGGGGLGNEYFKSSTNRAPRKSTKGKKGEEGLFYIELELVVDAGLIGLPNAGKSTLINAITNTKSRVGSYPFTTVEPHLGDLFGFIIADIPGLIEGASEGKGLGHKFLKHISRTKMLVHLISLENDDVLVIYNTIRNELEKHDPKLLEKKEWIVLTKSDLVTEEKITESKVRLAEIQTEISVLSAQSGEGVKEFREKLARNLGESN